MAFYPSAWSSDLTQPQGTCQSSTKKMSEDPILSKENEVLALQKGPTISPATKTKFTRPI